MWELAVYPLAIAVVGVGSFEAVKHVQARRKHAKAEKEADEAGLTVQERERRINELLFKPSKEEMMARALAASRKHWHDNKHVKAKDDIRAPEGFFIGGEWSERLHILYTEAIFAAHGIREHAAFYDAGMNTFVKRRETLEKLVQKYAGMARRSPADFHKNFRLAQEYIEPVLVQMCTRPNSERGAMSVAEREAFGDALRLAYSLCPGSWRGLAEIIRFIAQDMTTEDLAGLTHTGKRAVKAVASRPSHPNDHVTGVVMASLAKTALARISRSCSFEEAATRPRVEAPEWGALWRQSAQQQASTAAAVAAQESAAADGDEKSSTPPTSTTPASSSADKRRLCGNTDCFEVEGRIGDGKDAKPTQFMRCSKCKLVAYCSVECQMKHWKAGHKAQCADLVKQQARAQAVAAAAKAKAEAAAAKAKQKKKTPEEAKTASK